MYSAITFTASILGAKNHLIFYLVSVAILFKSNRCFVRFFFRYLTLPLISEERIMMIRIRDTNRNKNNVINEKHLIITNRHFSLSFATVSKILSHHSGHQNPPRITKTIQNMHYVICEQNRQRKRERFQRIPLFGCHQYPITLPHWQ